MSLAPFDVPTSEVLEQPSADAGLGGRAIEGRSPLRLALARLRTDRMAWVAAGMIVLMALLAIVAPLISTVTGHSAYNPDLVNGTNSFGQPYGPGQAGFIFGTDNLGRDILVRVAYGARISLLVGVLATLLATVGGTVIGLVSGYFGGWIDALLARLMDAVLSFPYVLAAIVIASVFGGSLAPHHRGHRLLLVGRHRQDRARPDPLPEGEGVRRGRPLHRRGAVPDHVRRHPPQPDRSGARAGHPPGPGGDRLRGHPGLPRGGRGPPIPTWGNMLADDQGSAGFGAWWFWVFPSIALLITTLGFNLLGDSVRDALDPRTERIFAMRRKGAGATGGPGEPAPADSAQVSEPAPS